MALDEPTDDDRRETINGIDFVITERDASMLLVDGPVKLTYSDTGWFKGYRVSAKAAADGCC